MTAAAGSAAAVIDLGDAAADPTEPVPPRPWRWRWRRYRRWWRPVAGALVCAVVATCLSGGAASHPRRDAVVPTGDIRAVQVVGDRIYIGDSAGLVAYAMPGGRRLWRAGSPTAGWGAVGPVLLANVGDPDTAQVVALDSATGEQRWRRPGRMIASVVPRSGDRRRAAAVLEPPGAEVSAWYMGVDGATGDPLWTFDARGTSAQVWLTEPGSDAVTHLVVGDESGRVQVLDLAAGRVVAAADTGRRRSLAGMPPTGGWLGAIGDLILVAGSAPRDTVTAYRRQDMSVRWRTPGLGGAAGEVPATCGAFLLCQVQSDGSVVVDPTSGRRLWSASGPVEAATDRFAVTVRHVRGEAYSTTLELRDLATGTLQRRLPDSYVLGTRADGAVMLMRYDDHSGRAWVGELGQRSGRMETLRLLPHRFREPPACALAPGAVVCTYDHHEMGVWGYR